MLPEARLALARLGLGATDDVSCREAWHRILHFVATEEVVPEAVLLLRALDALTERNLPARGARQLDRGERSSRVGGSATFISALDLGNCSKDAQVGCRALGDGERVPRSKSTVGCAGALVRRLE